MTSTPSPPQETKKKNRKDRKIRIVCISDTHNHSPPSSFQLPKGDVLVHAGDLTNQGTSAEIEKAVAWLREVEFRWKVVVGGNHDLSLDPSYTPDPSRGWTVPSDDHERCRSLLEGIPGLVYLTHNSTTLHLPPRPGSAEEEEEEGRIITIFGSPYSPLAPEKKQNWAFQYAPQDAKTLWAEIPLETDLLVTHTPPLGYCDKSAHWTRGGCPALLGRLGRVTPKVLVCGHCHEGRGAVVVRWGERSENDGCEGVSEVGVESVRQWEDPGAGSKKQSLLDLTGWKGGLRLERGRETAVVNASVMAKSWERKGATVFHKPVVVDVLL